MRRKYAQKFGLAIEVVIFRARECGHEGKISRFVVMTKVSYNL
jgi:hypothetical protein